MESILGRPMHRNIRQKKSFALILVLFFLALISVLIFGFLASISTEGEAPSQNAANAMRTSQLADSAMNVVAMAQIVAATSRNKPGYAGISTRNDPDV